SPLIDGRVDIAKYANGLRVCENFIPSVQGPAVRRAGTKYVAEVKSSANRTWLAKFEFSATQSFVLEFGDQYIRFYYNRGQLLSSGSPYEIVSPYLAADLTTSDGTFALDMVQSGDVIYIAHPSYPLQKLSRLGNTNWTIAAAALTDGPFKALNIDRTITVSSSGTTGTVTLTSSSGIFQSSHVGALFFLQPQDFQTIKPWQAGEEFTTNPVGIYRRSNGKTYVCATSGTPTAGKVWRTGGDAPNHSYGTQADGGFGGKTGIYPEDVVLAHAARVLGRPVKWIAERSEEFLSATHGRDIDSCAQMALDAEGKILALRVHTVANVGAYALGAGVAIQVMIGPWVQTSVYDIQTIDFQYTAVMTNTTPTGPYRGAGRPEAIYIIERLMEAAARKIGIDGAELRLKNMIQPDQFPYKNAMGQVYDSGNFPSMTRQACELADWSGFEARYQDSLRRGQWRGRGIASFLEWTGGNALEETVRVTVAADGYIEIVSATMPMGQGIATTYVQLAVDAFGVPVEKIRIIQGDTDRAEGFGSAGSRSLFTGGSAIEVAAHKVIDKAKEIAADALEVAQQDLVYGEGRFQVMGTDRGIGLFEVAARSDSGHIQLDSSTKVAGPSWPNACHICEVEIDPETMEVSLIAYASMNDVGRVVNPMIVRGQLDGGAVQGIGQALTEAMVYDASAQPLSASFLDYAMPRADLIGRFKTEMDQTVPCKNNPLGVKGVGELGTIGATPALVNAVADALARAGHGDSADALQMPLSAPRLWRLLHRDA
ncbi:MAG: hypothetical protein EBX02_05260, partial [Betaproteobacteria bacterium]|nr:hypothetical protein [Betaproteobacteria bacterium]